LTYGKEMLATLMVVKKWWYFLGRLSMIHMGQKSIIYNLDQRFGIEGQNTWLWILSEFDFKVENKRGGDSRVANPSLSERKGGNCHGYLLNQSVGSYMVGVC